MNQLSTGPYLPLFLQSIPDLLDKLGVKGRIKQDALAAFRRHFVTLAQISSSITDQARQFLNGALPCRQSFPCQPRCNRKMICSKLNLNYGVSASGSRGDQSTFRAEHCHQSLRWTGMYPSSSKLAFIPLQPDPLCKFPFKW
jgi:hypothetical protein